MGSWLDKLLGTQGDEISTMTRELVDAIRAAEEAGISEQQLAAVIHVSAGAIAMSRAVHPDEVVGRCREIHKQMTSIRSFDAKRVHYENRMLDEED